MVEASLTSVDRTFNSSSILQQFHSFLQKSKPLTTQNEFERCFDHFISSINIISSIRTYKNLRIVFWTCIDSSRLECVFLWKLASQVFQINFKLCFQSMHVCIFLKQTCVTLFWVKRRFLYLCNMWGYLTSDFVLYDNFQM